MADTETPPVDTPPVDPPVAETPPADPPADPTPNDVRVISELKAERAARKKAEARIKEYEDATKTEAEKQAEALAAAQKSAADAQQEILRLRVGKDLPDELQEFLTGTTEEELRAQVAKLLAATAPGGPRTPAPDPAQGAKPQATNVEAIDEAIAAAEKAGNIAQAITLKRQKAYEANKHNPRKA